jgi:hypothetical protein
MGSLSYGRSGLAAAISLAFGAAAALPIACAFPNYTYDLGTGGSTNHGSSGTVSMPTNTGTGAMTAASSGPSTSSSTGGPPPCAKRDCSDPTCAATFYCAPPVPTGWMGYFELYDNTGASPGCGGEWPASAAVGNDGIQMMDATCTCKPCAVSGEVCGPGGNADTMHTGTVDELLVVDAPCGSAITCGGPLEVPSGWGGACYGPDGFNAGATNCGPNSMGCTKIGSAPCNVAIQAQQLKLTGGTCGAPSQVMKTLPPVTWTNNAEACGTPMPGTGCAAMDHTCLAKPQGAFVKGVCVMQVGEVMNCPAGFNDRHVVYDPSKTMDTRTCGACTCGAMTGGSCSATITVYSDNTIDTCTTLIATLNPSTSQGDCKGLSGNPGVGSRQAVYGPVTPGTCAPGGGTPSGSLTPSGATTFCCTPPPP